MKRWNGGKDKYSKAEHRAPGKSGTGVGPDVPGGGVGNAAAGGGAGEGPVGLAHEIRGRGAGVVQADPTIGVVRLGGHPIGDAGAQGRARDGKTVLAADRGLGRGRDQKTARGPRVVGV